MSVKQRLSATVDADLMQAGQELVAAGRVESLSAWVNSALRAELERDRRLQSLKDLVASFEAEHGTITDAEMHAARRSARERAVIVRGRAR